MHFVTFVFLVTESVEYLDDRFAQNLGKRTHFCETTNPYAFAFSKLVHPIGHGLGYQYGQVGTLASHIGLEFFDPFFGESFGAFALVDDFSAFLSPLVAYGLDTVGAPHAFAYFRYHVKGEGGA